MLSVVIKDILDNSTTVQYNDTEMLKRSLFFNADSREIKYASSDT